MGSTEARERAVARERFEVSHPDLWLTVEPFRLIRRLRRTVIYFTDLLSLMPERVLAVRPVGHHPIIVANDGPLYNKRESTLASCSLTLETVQDSLRSPCYPRMCTRAAPWCHLVCRPRRKHANHAHA